MIDAFVGGDLQSAFEEVSGTAWNAARGLAQTFESGVGEQIMSASGLFEGVFDELSETFPVDRRLQTHTRLHTAFECGIRGAIDETGKSGVSDQPDGDDVSGVESEVEKGGKVAEEFGREVLRINDDPHGLEAFVIDHIKDVLLDLAPQGGAPIRRLQPQGNCQCAIDIKSAEVCFRQVDSLKSWSMMAAYSPSGRTRKRSCW